jgi:tetratricopeptide (TPR) repeat protein
MPKALHLQHRAFLSYSHADTRWAKWLHGKLEAFRIDKDLVGRSTPMGPVPRSLRPVFRDREDFTAGHTLSDQTLAALDASAALIVVCSPAAARSRYVNEEVRLFKQRHPGRPVVPVIVAGTPNVAEPSFVVPSPLVGEGQGGREPQTSAVVDPPTPNPSPRGGGESGAASAAGEECFPPALRFEVAADGAVTERPAEVLAADVRATGDGRELALAKVVAALIGLHPDDVRKRQAIAESRRIRIAAAAVAVVAVLALVAGFLYWQHEQQLAREAEREKDRIAREAARDKQIADMRALLVQKLVGSSPAQAQAAPGAEKAVGDAVEAAAKGAEQGDARLRRALELLEAGKPQEAEPLFRAVAEDKERAARASDKEAAAAYRHLGAIAGLRDPKRAREAYGKAVALNSEDREALYWHGYLQMLAGQLTLAERDLTRLLHLSETAEDERGLYRAHLRLGEILLDRGDLAGARQRQDQAHKIARLKADQFLNDLEWQRDLSVSQEKIGAVLVALGNLPEALQSFRDSFALADKLAKADPGNAGWQRDLSVSFDRVGDVLVAQGNLGEALQSFRDSLALADKLAKADPGNAGWQRDVAISHGRVAMVLARQGSRAEAARAFEQGRAIIARLRQQSPDSASLPRDLAWFEAQIAALGK